jgi:hypothetical protein
MNIAPWSAEAAWGEKSGRDYRRSVGRFAMPAVAKLTGLAMRAFDGRKSVRFRVLRMAVLQLLQARQRILAIKGGELLVDLGIGRM